MHVETRDGVKLHAQVLGSGPSVVMLHGLLVGNMTTWYWTAASRLAERHRVVLFDLRGHGLSERAPRGYDIATMTSDLASVIEELAPGPVDLVGHSYGAVTALTYALRHPGRVRRLAVVEAPLPPSRLEEMDRFLGRSPDAMLDALPEVLREALAGLVSPGGVSSDGRDGARGGRRGRRFVESLRFLATGSSLFDDLRRAEDIPDAVLATLACPLLAVYGTSSSCRPVGRRLAAAVPGARHVEMPGGHFLPLEAGQALTQVLTEFLDG
jgi:pimeloyl-ACP methyl ester carboxylesterase